MTFLLVFVVAVLVCGLALFGGLAQPGQVTASGGLAQELAFVASAVGTTSPPVAFIRDLADEMAVAIVRGLAAHEPAPTTPTRSQTRAPST